MKRKTWVALAGAVVVIGAVLGWAFSPRPIPVETAPASVGLFETAVQEDGRTRVLRRHVVTAPLSGRLRRLAWREGDALTTGQELAIIDPLASPLLDERSEQEQLARVAAVEAALQRAATRVRAAQVGLEQATLEQQRSAELAAQGFVSQAKLDANRLATQAAQREVETALDSQRIAQFELAQARATMAPALGQAAASVVRRPHIVYAPASGVVLKVHQISEGQVAVGTPLLDLGNTREIEVVAELLSSDVSAIPPGASVRIDRWGGDAALNGRVRRIEPAAFTKVSALGVEEQRVNALIDLDSGADGLPSPLGDGWRVVVNIITRREPQALRVPVSAVFPWPQAVESANPQRMGVFVVQGGRAKLVPIEVAGRNATYAWVRSGIAPGTEVIAYPAPAVVDGVRIRTRGR